MLMRFALLLPAVVLAGCDHAQSASPLEQKVQWAEEASRQPATVSGQVTSRGELLKIEIPVRVGKTLVERQTCFVWRDAEYRTASMQCPSDTTVPTSGGAPERDPPYRP